MKNRHGYKKVIKYLKINESLIITKISFFFLCQCFVNFIPLINLKKEKRKKEEDQEEEKPSTVKEANINGGMYSILTGEIIYGISLPHPFGLKLL